MNYKLTINDVKNEPFFFYKDSAQILTASFLKLTPNDIVEYRIKN